jgi:hypothetical protein
VLRALRGGCFGIRKRCLAKRILLQSDARRIVQFQRSGGTLCQGSGKKHRADREGQDEMASEIQRPTPTASLTSSHDVLSSMIS